MLPSLLKTFRKLLPTSSEKKEYFAIATIINPDFFDKKDAELHTEIVKHRAKFCRHRAYRIRLLARVVRVLLFLILSLDLLSLISVITAFPLKWNGVVRILNIAFIAFRIPLLLVNIAVFIVIGTFYLQFRFSAYLRIIRILRFVQIVSDFVYCYVVSVCMIYFPFSWRFAVILPTCVICNAAGWFYQKYDLFDILEEWELVLTEEDLTKRFKAMVERNVVEKV